MFKPAFWIWLLAATVLTGVFITGLLQVQSIQGGLKPYFIGAAVLAMVLAAPFALWVRKGMEGPTGPEGTAH